MIDFHCHLDLYPDPKAIVNRPELASMYVLAVTTTPAAWEGNQELVRHQKRVRVAFGLHPELVGQRAQEIDHFIELLPHARYVGEVGLDGSPQLRWSFHKQDEVFRRILQACRAEGGRVLSIHSRRATEEVLNAISEEKSAGTPILHWFSGTAKQLERAIGMGCWFSVGPRMLASDAGRRLAAAMPPDRVLTETDGPFASQQGISLVPWDVRYAEEALQQIWQTRQIAVKERLLGNLRSLLGKDA